MARDSDHRAGDFETDNTGGLLSGLLAEEDDLDRRALWRIGSWGVGAVAAVVVAVMANQSSLGLKREQMAAVELTRQAQQIQLTARENQSETRRLASAVDTLNGDRDRLYSRVTSLEQGLDSVTGSFIRQLPPNAAASGPALATTEPPAALAPAPVLAPVTTAAAATDKPATKATAPEPSLATISSVAKDAPKTESGKAEKTESAKSDAAKSDVARLESAKTEPARTDASRVDAAKADVAKADIAKVDVAKPDATKPDVAKTDPARTDPGKPEAAKTPAATPATPLVAAKSFMAPPDPSATKLIEPNKPISPVTASPIPEVVASAPVSDEEADDATAPKVALQRTEFGVDLGTANSVSGLRALWRGLLKSRSNAPLQALRPVIMIKERTNGLGMQLHLVAGPLNDAGAAAKICAVMTENERSCETTVFDGQRLSFRDDVTPAPAAPAKPASRKRGTSSKRAAVVVEEPKKPETTSSISSSISSMFGRKSAQ
ncbi:MULTISPECIES: hypothetical protein [Bradyrhizobium]|uniref:SPOR domain-containing protein n=2 Tax=Bradyrhizobium TaxID=374 RepID=A0ABY0QG09_9BRAD|nr:MULTISPECIES: hypothetical protein [Bradyrhizobium]SDK23237.1 hypothetical protein SAMN05444163_7568 [Bradyrhizobium ottawaense]SEE45751.1 hypothetical protein SAMN05444171_7564 [Bradyrhizobium lablabi]